MTGPNSTGVGQHLQIGAYRAADIPDDPVLFSGVSNNTLMGRYLAIVHPSGERIRKVWDDSRLVAFESLVHVSTPRKATSSGRFGPAAPRPGGCFKVKMPDLPS
ncbi:hypothetical protein CA951_38160 [Rhodococcus sp. NCIMB 12038]|nr:hypothetical protein CA951_38160 [Rhodococcus sp. NCIMB 12038]